MDRPPGKGRLAAIALAVLACATIEAQAARVDLAGYRPECGVEVEHRDGRLTLRWPIATGEIGRLTLDLVGDRPLIAEMAIAASPESPVRSILANVDPVAFLTVGERRLPKGRPPGMSVFNAFFDNPAQRPFQKHRSEFTLGAAYEGPPGCVHGGYVAAAFDELLGATQSLSGAPGMTGTLTVRYESPTPLDTPLRIEGRLVGVERRKIFTEGTCYAGDRVTATAQGLFISMQSGQFLDPLAEREARQADIR